MKFLCNHHFNLNYRHKTDRLGDKFLIHFFQSFQQVAQVDDVSALEKEDSVLEFMRESGL